MLLMLLNVIFAGLFLSFARHAFRRAVPFLRIGYAAVSVEVQKPDYRTNIDSRQAISEGGRFLMGGMLWLLIMVMSLAIALFFAIEAVRLYTG